MLKKKTISLDSRFSLPEKTTVVHHKGKILIIASECANYIVLENDKQLNFYNLLQTLTLGEALKESATDTKTAQAVLVQIEAKKFENKIIPHSNGRLQMHLFLTNKCNLRCKHCYMLSGDKYDKELTYDEICSLLKAFSLHGGEFVTFSGGEVTTRKDFLEILKEAHGLGLHINIMTNGTLWDNEMIEKASTFVESVQISIDGFNETENAKVRGSGHFDKSLQTADLFLRHNIRTTIAITPWPDENLTSHIEHYVQFKHRLLAKYQGFPLEIKFTEELMDGRDLKTTSELRNDYSQTMKKISSVGHENMEEDIFVYNQERKILKDSWCTYGHLTITATGEVYFCGKIQLTKSVGNIREMDLPTVMNLSKKARELAKTQSLHPCGQCELKYICGGGCRILHFPQFADNRNVYLSSDSTNTHSRECDASLKGHYYDLMIQANKRLYK